MVETLLLLFWWKSIRCSENNPTTRERVLLKDLELEVVEAQR